MSDQEKGNGGANGARERLKEEFAALPLDKKLASLFELEVVALSESFSYVVNSSGDIFNKVADVVNDFGRKVECEFKKGTGQADATATENAAPEASEAEKSEQKPKGQKKAKDGE